MTLTPDTTRDTGDLTEEVAELTEATRRLMLAAATTDVGADELRAARARMDELSAALGRRSRPRAMRTGFDGPRRAREAGRVWSLGRANPEAFPLDLHFDADVVRATTVPNALYEGPPHSVHGGFIAHLMDCMLGTLVQSTGRRAMTASLELTYRSRTPLDVPVDLGARIVETTGRKIVAESWIDVDGARTVDARGLFIELKEIPWPTS
jgi:acyl-coenzyme A thioesterase PaaI-like protein